MATVGVKGLTDSHDLWDETSVFVLVTEVVFVPANDRACGVWLST